MLLLKFDSKLVLKLDNRLSADNEISHNNLLNHLGWSWSWSDYFGDYFGGNFDGDMDVEIWTSRYGRDMELNVRNLFDC